MTIQTFKSFIAEADAEDYVSPTDDDAEVKGLQPRSKGEQDFADAHVTTVLPHPVATDAQFVPKVAHSPHTGLEQEEDGERNFLKSYKDMFGNGSASQTTTRRGDNRTGDLTPVNQGSSVMHTTRESVDLDEAVIDPKVAPKSAKVIGNTEDGYRLVMTFPDGHVEALPLIGRPSMSGLKKIVDKNILKHEKGIRKTWVPVVSAAMKKKPVNEEVDLDEAVKLSPAEASLLNTAMKTMSKENAKEFRQDALTSPANLKKALAFAKGVI